ncbi:MAG TPA: hypothetical protein VF937_03850 [Chloroflexota bacterium]
MNCTERHRAAAVAAALWVLVAGLLALYLVLFVASAAGRLGRPLEEFTYGESWLLDGARQVARGEGLYAPADQMPLMHIAYTPVYYALVGGLLRVLGDSGYTLGRAVSLAATLVAAGALAWSLRRLTAHWWVGLLAAGLFLTQNVTALLWGPLERVDPLALAFTLIGLALCTAGRTSLGGLALLLALATKQAFVIAPLVVAIWLWPCRPRFVRFVAIVGGGSIGGVLLGQGLTHGWFLWHTVVANSNESDLNTFAALMGSFLQYNGVPVLAALASLAVPSAHAPGQRLWRLYFVGCLLTLASVAKLGASSNYWLELTAATSVMLALASYRLAAQPAARLVAPTIIAGSLLIAVPAYQATAVEVADTLAEGLRPSTPRYLSLVGDGDAATYRVDARFVEQVAREPGELLTDNAGLAVAAGKRVAFEFQIFQLLEAEGRWSEQPILDAIARRRFSLVALMHPLDGPVQGTRWTPTLQSALEASYVLHGSDSGFWLYRPRS